MAVTLLLLHARGGSSPLESLACWLHNSGTAPCAVPVPLVRSKDDRTIRVLAREQDTLPITTGMCPWRRVGEDKHND